MLAEYLTGTAESLTLATKTVWEINSNVCSHAAESKTSELLPMPFLFHIYIYMHICLEGLLLPELWQNRRPLNDQSCLESLEVEGMFPQSPEQQLHPATSFMDDLDECLESRV